MRGNEQVVVGLPVGIRRGWVNLGYSASMNASHPTLNPDVDGPPYFTDAATAMAGQWVRVVLRPNKGREFWCVGSVTELVGDAVLFDRLGYEGGAAKRPRMFKAPRWSGALAREGDEYVVMSMRPQDGTVLSRVATYSLRHDDGRRLILTSDERKATIEIHLPGERIDRTYKYLHARRQAEVIVGEQLDDGFVIVEGTLRF